MTSNRNDPLSDVDRRSMRILARSTKASGPANARIAERLEKAAGSGDRSDYRRAEESFDALPPRERRRIGTHAERQAVTERELAEARKRRPVEPKVARPDRPKTDDSLDWKPIVMNHSPAADPSGDEAWAPDKQQAGGSKKPAQSVPRPAAGKDGKPAGKSARPGTAPKPQRPILKVEPPAEQKPEPDDDGGGWDWRRVPDDPVLKGTRKKAALDPIEELRRQMLGDDSKSR